MLYHMYGEHVKEQTWLLILTLLLIEINLLLDAVLAGHKFQGFSCIHSHLTVGDLGL